MPAPLPQGSHRIVKSKSRSKLTQKNEPPWTLLERSEKVRPPCSALTLSNEACRNSVTALPRRNNLPLCWSHRKLTTIAYCQGPLGDSRKCLKKIPWTERQQLCYEHRDAVLPCYLMRLPTELRQEIFLYLYKDDSRAYAGVNLYRKYTNRVCFLNRQIYHEATDVFYRNFECRISSPFGREGDLFIMGQACRHPLPGYCQKFNRFRFELRFHQHIKPYTEKLQAVIAHLRNSYIISLRIKIVTHGCPNVVDHWKDPDSRFNRSKGPTVYDILPPYMDAFLPLAGVNNLRVSIEPDMKIMPEFDLLGVLHRYRCFSREKEKLEHNKASTELALKAFLSYYRDWTQRMKHGIPEGA